MSTFLDDFKHGFHILAKQPLFTVVATLILTVGIGANIFMFSIVNAYLLFPLPFPDAERLVDLTDTNSGFGRMSVAYANFLDWRQQNQTLEQVACYRNVGSTLAGVETAERIQGMQINASLFPMLGVAPALGRLFNPSDDHGQAERTVVLSHACWQKRFDAAPEAIGQSMILDGDAYTVIGVLPPTFRFPAYYLHGAEFWTSIGLLEKQTSFMGRGNHSGTCAIGKLKPGVTVAQARADLNRVAEQLEQIYPDTNGGCRVALTGYHQQLLGDDGFPVIVFMGAVTFVLLIVCVNVANLLLVRFNARLQEFSVRSALGAGRWRLARQLLCENLVLALLGGAGGLFVGFGGIHLLIALLGVPSWAVPETIYHPDMNVLLFVLGTILGTGLIFGLLPAGFVARANLSANLTGTAHRTTTSRAHGRLRNALVLAQIAMALVLLFGAGLMLRSFLCHLQADPGYNPANAVAMNLHLSDQTYNSPDKQIACYREFLRGIKPLPGASHVGLCTHLMGGWQAPYYVENAPIPEPSHRPRAEFNRVSSDYFRAMGMRLLEGRPFAPSDNKDAPPVVIVDEQFARKWWPGESAVGKRLQIHRDQPDNNVPWAQVVGTVNHIKPYGVDQPSRESIYTSVYRHGAGSMALVVRTQGDPLRLVASIRQLASRIDPDLPVSNIQTLQAIRDGGTTRRRTITVVLGVVGVAALFLAALGIYGVMAYTVSQRTQEFGIRMAMGACVTDIIRLVLGQGLRLAIPGILLGLAACFGLGWLIRSLLFGVASWDPLTFVGVTIALVGTVLLACYIPARRATKIDPMDALRYE